MNRAHEVQGIGVPRYIEPAPARYRALFGFGGNVGLGLLTPSTFVGDASYQSGRSIVSAGFITSASVTQDLPYRTYSEFDLLYGIAFENVLPRYEGPSEHFHTSLSAGVSFDWYQERWRPFGRRGIPDYLYPPATFRYSLGVPIQLQAIYEPLRFFGIGVGFGGLLFCNLSGFTPSYGGAVVVEARY